jgi:hypothetical protein
MSERDRRVVASMELAPVAFPVTDEPVAAPAWMQAEPQTVRAAVFARTDAGGAAPREGDGGGGARRSLPPPSAAGRPGRPVSLVPPPHPSAAAAGASGAPSMAPPSGDPAAVAAGANVAPGGPGSAGASVPPSGPGSAGASVPPGGPRSLIPPAGIGPAGTPSQPPDSGMPRVAADPRDAEAFASAVAELTRARAAALAEAERALLELSVHIAEALVERELRDDPTLHRALVRAALAPLEDQRPTAVRASRDAFGAIVDAFGTPAVDVDGVVVPVVLDASLDGLGVVVDGPAMRVDGRVSERLRAVARALEDERRRAADEEAA